MPLPLLLLSGKTKLAEIVTILEEETKMEKAEVVTTPS